MAQGLSQGKIPSPPPPVKDAVRLEHLALRNFRTYREAEAHLPPGLILFSGGNAQGKTNLLEAVYLLALTRSPRAENDREVVNWQAIEEGAPYTRVAGRFGRRDGSAVTVQVDMALLGHGQGKEGLLQKRVRVDNRPRAVSQAVGVVNAVLFSPEDIGLVTGPPALRRRFLDLLLSQVDRSYLHALQRYQKVLSQRNALLERVAQGKAPAEEVSVWDQETCRLGALLTISRRQATQALAPAAAHAYTSLTEGRERFEVRYASSVEHAGATEEVAERFRAKLEALRPREIGARQTLVGPHRDDLALAVEGKELGTYGSRGQARTAALALRLAEARFLAGQRGEEPLLLLDDLLSELDSGRRARVLETLGRAEQALLTVVDTDLYPEVLRQASAHLQVRRTALFPAPLPSPLGP